MTRETQAAAAMLSDLHTRYGGDWRLVFAAYNHLASTDAAIEVYPYNGHEGGGGHHWTKQVDWLRARL